MFSGWDGGGGSGGISEAVSTKWIPRLVAQSCFKPRWFFCFQEKEMNEEFGRFHRVACPRVCGVWPRQRWGKQPCLASLLVIVVEGEILLSCSSLTTLLPALSFYACVVAILS